MVRIFWLTAVMLFVKGKEQGNYVNPTIIAGVEPTNECACDEIFRPVLTVLRVGSLDEALAKKMPIRMATLQQSTLQTAALRDTFQKKQARV